MDATDKEELLQTGKKLVSVYFATIGDNTRMLLWCALNGSV